MSYKLKLTSSKLKKGWVWELLRVSGPLPFLAPPPTVSHNLGSATNGLMGLALLTHLDSTDLCGSVVPIQRGLLWIIIASKLFCNNWVGNGWQEELQGGTMSMSALILWCNDIVSSWAVVLLCISLKTHLEIEKSPGLTGMGESMFCLKQKKLVTTCDVLA